MNPEQIIGILMIGLVLTAVVGMMVKVAGWRVTAVVWAFALSGAALIVAGVYLITGEL